MKYVAVAYVVWALFFLWGFVAPRLQAITPFYVQAGVALLTAAAAWYAAITWPPSRNALLRGTAAVVLSLATGVGMFVIFDVIASAGGLRG